MRVRAKTGPFPYGFKYRRAGQEFEMDDRHVSMYEKLGYVERVVMLPAAPPQREVPQAQPSAPRKKKKRTYKRRDLTAE